VKTDISCEKGLPEGEGGFSDAKMIRVYGYAIVASGRINNFLQKGFSKGFEALMQENIFMLPAVGILFTACCVAHLCVQ
jgi:hypothetical protein